MTGFEPPSGVELHREFKLAESGASMATWAEFWAAIVPGLPALFGALVGGVIALVAANGLEGRRIREQRRSEFLRDTRESIKLSLAWIEPIAAALEAATALSDPDNELALEEMEQQWPALSDELTKRQLPPESRYLLPRGTYHELNDIVRELDSVRFAATRLRQDQANLKALQGTANKARLEFAEASYHTDQLAVRGTLKALKAYSNMFVRRLLDEYRATYGEPPAQPRPNRLLKPFQDWFARQRKRRLERHFRGELNKVMQEAVGKKH